jgi:hypothetical protein
MPRPNWDPSRPLDSDQVSSFPALYRGDKTTLKDIIGTLGPFGSTTTTWRQVQIGYDTWLVQNLYFDGNNWNRDDTTKASVAIGLRSNGTVTVHKVAAGANPVGASLPSPIATLDATSLFGALVAGTDPGGTEALRAQNLRAGATTLTDALSAPTVVVGTDPGGTESLRAGSARLNAPVLLGSVPQFTVAADPTNDLQVATKRYVDNRVTDLDALDARYVNVTGDTMTGALVVGTDPGGTELLRAQSLRAGSGRVGSWRPIGVIRPTSDVTSVVFSGLSLSPPALLRLVAVIRPSGTGVQDYHLRVNDETNSNDWAEQLLFARSNTVGGMRFLDFSRIANFDAAGSFSVTHCSVIIAVASNGGVRVSSWQSFAEATDAPILAHFGLVKNTTITELSSLSIVGNIAADSVFYLEYLGP